MIKTDYFKDKKVTVMGLGLLGRGIGDARYVAEAGAKEVLVTDLKTEAELASSVASLKGLNNIKLVLGKHQVEDFTNSDLVIMAAGVPLDSPYIVAAKAAGVQVSQSGALFAWLSKIPIIGVTGTRGKSTVTHMVHHVLSTVTAGSQVLLGGNIRGVSNLQLLNDVEEDSLAVMELDSWQLQGFGDMEISPQIAVFTSFMPDHMNYYHDDMELYFKDKAQIFLHQEESGVLVTTPDVFNWVKKVLPTATLGQEVILTDSSDLPEDCLLAMPGDHNRLNAALAYKALKATGLEDEEIYEGLTTFPGVPGRLEYLGEKNGVKIYNDNNATTPAATVAGLEAVGQPKKVVLIMGGASKGLDAKPLLEAVGKYCKSVVLLPGTGSDEIVDEVKGVVVESLEAAVQTAIASAVAGDIILFSPAFASFGLFKNEYERNDQFVEIVNDLE